MILYEKHNRFPYIFRNFACVYKPEYSKNNLI